jgi:negative regulator of sigma E activity
LTGVATVASVYVILFVGLHQLYNDKQLGRQNDERPALQLSPKPLSNSTVIVAITSSHSATDREAS